MPRSRCPFKLPVKGSFWYFFLLFFIAIFIPVMILGSWFLFYRVNMHRKDVTSAYEARVASISSGLESQIQALDTFAAMQSVNPWITKLTYMSAPINSGRVKPGELSSYTEQLRTITVLNPLVLDVSMLFKSKDYAICSEGISTATRFINNLYQTDYDYKTISDITENTSYTATLYSSALHMRRLTHEGDSYGPTLLRLYTVCNSPKGNTVLIAYIPLKNIEQYLKANFDFSDLYLTISGADGTSYLSMGETPPGKGSLHLRQPRGVFVLDAEIPGDAFWAGTKTLLLLAGLAGVVILLLIVSMSYFLSTSQIKQLHTLLNLGSFAMGSRRTFNYMQLGVLISGLANSEEHLRKENERIIPVLRNELLRRLLLGIPMEHKLIEASMGYVGFSFNCFTVCLAPSALRITNAELEEELNSADVQAHCFEVDKDMVAVLLNHEDGDLQPLIETIGQAVSTQGIKPAVFIGKTVKNTENIHDSYEDAKWHMEYRSTTEVYIQSQEDGETPSWFYYPINAETRIINAMNTYNFDDVTVCIDEIFAKNEMEALLSQSTSRLLAISMAYTAHRVVNMNNLFSAPILQIKEINAIGSLEEARAYVNKLFSTICAQMMEHEERADKYMRKRIADFIQENYSNPDMSLSMLSGFMNKPEYELSRLIKKWNGMNFLDIIQQLRINMACKMIAEGVNLKDVALQTGFSSDITFRRTFKKIIGLSPGEYRKACELDAKESKGGRGKVPGVDEGSVGSAL